MKGVRLEEGWTDWNPSAGRSPNPQERCACVKVEVLDQTSATGCPVATVQ